ncbi:mycothiol transferase [Propionibacterium sp.]|uniref:mycothiol transferase n=1 Tax=Propionibacterium sp. TaxID=1977903 RepID=UPI0039EC1201
MTVDALDILTDSFDRGLETLPALLDGLGPEDLLWRPGPDANPIAWLSWHIDRCMDAQMAPLMDLPQIWDQGWRERFGLPYPPLAMGYGQTSEEVAQFDLVDAQLLLGYHHEVAALVRTVLAAERNKDLGRIVDTRWDPPVTAAVRLVSVINDVNQHTGQIAYLKGLLASR